jgi:7-keto-8-aminopelargonate synthetase-like enzyme
MSMGNDQSDQPRTASDMATSRSGSDITPSHLSGMTLEEKRALARDLLRRGREAVGSADNTGAQAYTRQTYDMFMFSRSPGHDAATRFAEWVNAIKSDGLYAFEATRLQGPTAEIDVERDPGERLHMLNMSSYNYLGYGHHPQVIAAAKDALERYGLGAASSPIVGGTLRIHQELERALVDFFALPDRDATLFSSGYAINMGTISAFVHQGHHVVLDRGAHASLVEGAKLSGASISFYRHNDGDHLERLLGELRCKGPQARILVCSEGVFSTDGDFGNLARIAAACRRHGAYLLVDEAHSVLVAGHNGRGVADMQGVLNEIDLLVITFSKAFGAVGGALIAHRDIVQYVRWYAKCRMFSCAIDPAATGGALKALELASSSDGNARRSRILANAAYFRQRLRERLIIREGEGWIVPVEYGSERLTIPLYDYLQRSGLDSSIMQFPAVGKNEARIRLFVTSEHVRHQLDRAVSIIFAAAGRFGFADARR